MCGEQSRAWPSSPHELPPLPVYAGSGWRPRLLGGREHGPGRMGTGAQGALRGSSLPRCPNLKTLGLYEVQ